MLMSGFICKDVCCFDQKENENGVFKYLQNLFTFSILFGKLLIGSTNSSVQDAWMFLFVNVWLEWMRIINCKLFIHKYCFHYFNRTLLQPHPSVHLYIIKRGPWATSLSWETVQINKNANTNYEYTVTLIKNKSLSSWELNDLLLYKLEFHLFLVKFGPLVLEKRFFYVFNVPYMHFRYIAIISTWIKELSFIWRKCVPGVFEIGPLTLYSFATWLLYPHRNGQGPSFERLEYPSLMDAKC